MNCPNHPKEAMFPPGGMLCGGGVRSWQCLKCKHIEIRDANFYD